MAISLLVNTSAGSGAGAEVTTGAIDTTGANCLVAAVSSWSQGGHSLCRDSKTNQWHELGSYIQGSSESRISIFVSFPSSVGSGHTFSSGAEPEFPAIAVAAFSGVSQSIIYNSTAGATSLSPGSYSLAQSADLLIAGMASLVPGTVSVDASFSITNQEGFVTSQHYGCVLAYRIVNTGTITPTFSWSGSVGAAAIVVSLNLAGGGGGGESAFVF